MKNKIEISKDGNEKIYFTWKKNNKVNSITLNIKNEDDYENNSFDKLFDYIIDCIENNEEVIFELNQDIEKNDSRINLIAIGIKEMCEKEINDIIEQIRKDTEEKILLEI